MTAINILTAARIARSHGLEVTRGLLQRVIIPNLAQANDLHGKPVRWNGSPAQSSFWGSRDGGRTYDALAMFDGYMSSEAYERGCDAKALRQFHSDAYGDG